MPLERALTSSASPEPSVRVTLTFLPPPLTHLPGKLFPTGSQLEGQEWAGQGWAGLGAGGHLGSLFWGFSS
jgi:hypothetical protein